MKEKMLDFGFWIEVRIRGGIGGRRGRRRSIGSKEGDAVDSSDPSGWVATGGGRHRNLVTFGEAFVKPFLGDLSAFGAFFLRRDGMDFGFGKHFRQDLQN
jgi:hypothetical protein